MREILFRGQTRRKGEKVWMNGTPVESNWVYGGVFQGPNKSIIYSYEPVEKHVVYSDTVGQFTGLTDKNGKRIFEGDIVRYADIYDYNCYLESLENPEAYEGVDYSDIWTIDKVVYGIAINYPAFDLNRHNFEVNGLSELSESGNFFYEVIGNIHDHPELLKGE